MHPGCWLRNCCIHFPSELSYWTLFISQYFVEIWGDGRGDLVVAFSAWGRDVSLARRVLCMDPSVSAWITWLGFASLNRWFRSSLYPRRFFLTHLPQPLYFSGSRFFLQDWVLELKSLVGRICWQQKWKRPFHFSVTAQCELCIRPLLILRKSLLAEKLCDVFFFFLSHFFLVLGPLEILILNPFSNIKFLAKVKKKALIFFFFFDTLFDSVV